MSSSERMCAWGGPFCAAAIGTGLLLAGFIPPPSPNLTADQIAALYRENGLWIRAGMILSLFGIIGWAAQVACISAQMARMKTSSKLPAYLQLGAGMIGILTVMFPNMVLAVAAFRPERDPALTQLLNDTGWLITIAAFPTFVAQFGAIAIGVLSDRGADPVFPRWTAYFNIWIALLFVPGGLDFLFRTGPFAWNGILSFWVAASAFFVWLMVMTPVTLRAIRMRPTHERI